MSSRKLRTDTYANMYRLLKDINSLKKDVENLKKIKADDDNFSSLFAHSAQVIQAKIIEKEKQYKSMQLSSDIKGGKKQRNKTAKRFRSKNKR